MGIPSDEAVEITIGKSDDEPTVVTVNCPDKIGLGCDLCHIILEFGLRIKRGDVSTDGKWCFVVLWVIPRTPKINFQWSNLKSRILSLCPSCPIPFYFDAVTRPTVTPVYLLKLLSLDRKGLLHDVTHVLCELELCIHRVKVSTMPDGRVMDLFFITDCLELLHTKKRQEDTCQKLNTVLGDSCISCELQSAEDFQQGFSSLSPSVADELFRSEISEGEVNSQAYKQDVSKLKEVNVVIDNTLSPSRTLLQIHSVDQKGLLYDILRPLKDCSIQIAYGRFMSDNKGHREVDLFITHSGKKILDKEKQESIVARLRRELLHPLRVIIVNRGPDAELLVANPVELSGKGRPLVFYDVTLALKLLGVCIFSAEIGRQTTLERQWEVYRFRLVDSRKFPLADRRARSQIVEKVRRTLMGW